MDDTISRAKAIEIVNFECGEWEGLAQRIVNGMGKLPSAQPEIKTRRCRRCAHAVCESPYDGDDGWCLYAERR